MNIFEASKAGDVARLTELLAARTNPDSRDPLQRTPLMHAVEKDRTECMKLLISKGANLNLQNNVGVTALMTAARLGYMKSIQLLSEAGADTTVKTPGNKTARDIAIQYGKQQADDFFAANNARSAIEQMLRSLSPPLK